MSDVFKPNMGVGHRPIVVPPADQAWARGAKLPPNGAYPRLYLLRDSLVIDTCDDLPVLRFESDQGFYHAFDWCYGLPLVSDPREFYPDPFVSSPQQIMEHQSACTALENGYEPMLLNNYPTMVNPWGIGISLIPKE